MASPALEYIVEARPQPLIDEVYAFCRSIGLPTTLAQIGLEGVTDRELDAAIHPVFDNKQSYLRNARFDLTPVKEVKKA